jgi:hypothetical protein
VLPSATSPTATIVAIGFAGADDGATDDGADDGLAGAGCRDDGGDDLVGDDGDGADLDDWHPATSAAAATPTSSARLPRCRITTLPSGRGADITTCKHWAR